MTSTAKLILTEIISQIDRNARMLNQAGLSEVKILVKLKDGQVTRVLVKPEFDFPIESDPEDV